MEILILLFTIGFALVYFGMGNNSQSQKKIKIRRKNTKRHIKTWAEQVAETRQCVNLYFQKNKIGDLHNIKCFLIEHHCLPKGEKIWHEILDEINQMIQNNKITPFLNKEDVWESNYSGAAIDSRIIKL